MFHVPNTYRLRKGRLGSNDSYGNNGAFVIPSSVGKDRNLIIIASDGMGWEHVSAHAEKGKALFIPMWDEMCFIKDLFWDDEDVVIQYHPRKSEYVQNDKYTLHLWRPVGIVLPTPPTILVGDPRLGELRGR